MEEDTEDERTPIAEEDYYAFLNVSKDALNDEITNAYRRLSRLYHPDKHVDPARKKEAEIMFNKTKKAYEVLRDPHKRAIYDSVGVRGLETEGWEIMQRTKTPQEIREEYDRLARIREERRLQQRTNPKGNVTVNINATDLFSSYFYDDYDLGDNFPIIEISGMSLMQSIESPLTSRDTATMSGHLSTHNGTGTGGVTVSNKRTLSEKGWVEVLAGAGNGPLLGLKGFRTLTKRIFTTAETHLQFAPNGIRTSIDTTVAMQLDRHTMGYLSWRGGSSSGMSTTVARDTEKGHITGTVLLGVPHSYISLAYTWKLKEREIKIKAAVKAGTFGAALEYAAEKKVSEHSTISALVSVGVPTGVILKIKFVRANQTYNFPIHLCEEVMPSPVFYATVTPLVVWAVVKRLIIDPIVLERTERGRQRQKDNYKNRMAEKRREAQAATNLMSVTFARIRSEEEARRGLVIVSAVYGKLGSSGTPTSTTTSSFLGEGSAANQQQQDEIVDVTIPLQCLVKDSKLVIYESTKSQLPGFYDPCVGEEKFLCVQYLFHNQLHQTTVGDTEPLRIPRQSHRVSPS